MLFWVIYSLGSAMLLRNYSGDISNFNFNFIFEIYFEKFRRNRGRSKFCWMAGAERTKRLVQILDTKWALAPSLPLRDFLLSLAVGVGRQPAEFQMSFRNWNVAF